MKHISNVTKYKIKSQESTFPLSGCPKDFILQGSNNDATWINIDTQTGVTWIGNVLEEKEFILLDVSETFKYLRLVINATSNGEPPLIVDLKFFKRAINTTGGVLQIREFPYQTSNTSPNTVTANRFLERASPPTVGMTSNTAPSGYVASSSSDYSATYTAWKAFDKSNASLWIAGNAQTTGWLKLKFPSSILINQYWITSWSGTDVDSLKDWTIEGSNDDVNWTLLDTRSNITPWTKPETKLFKFTNTLPFQYYRINILAANNDGTGTYFGITELIYSYEDFIPLMTSNTYPAGYVASASAEYFSTITYAAWRALDRQNANSESWLSNTPTGWLRVQLPSAVVVNRYLITSQNFTDANKSPKNFTFEGSNDGTAWTVLDTQANISWVVNETKTFSFVNALAFTNFRLNITVTQGGLATAIGELQITFAISYPTYYAFDGTDSTTWISGPTFITGDWLKLQLIEPTFITKYKIKSQEGTNPARGGPKKFSIQGSNNNVTWTTLSAKNNITWTGALEEKEFLLAGNSDIYQYFRIFVEETSNGSPVNIIDLHFTRMWFEGSNVTILPVSGYSVYDSLSTERASKLPLIPPMTSTTTPIGYEVKSSGDYNVPSAPWKAFDGDTNYPNAWYSSTVAPCWIYIKSPRKIRVKCFLIMPYNGVNNDPNYKLNAFRIEGSNDGINFTIIQSFTNDWVTFNGPTIFTLTQLSDPYFYFRLYVTATSTTYQAIVGEWILYDFDVWSVVPNMTADNVPIGYVASMIVCTRPPFLGTHLKILIIIMLKQITKQHLGGFKLKSPLL